MNDIVELMAKFAKSDGVNNTLLPGVRIYKTSKNTKKAPLLYNQGIIIIGQGSKEVSLGNRVFHYDSSNYLVLTVPLPLECQAFASNEKPLLGLTIDIDIAVLNNIINTMGDHIDQSNLERSTKNEVLFTASANPRFNDIVLRLLQSLDNPVDAKMLGRDLVKELVYRIMCGENASSLYALAMKNTKLSKIEMALKEIHSNYKETLDVNKLANIVNMSVSSFHHTFKEVTSSSPIQYLKKVRLSKAKDLLIEGQLRVNEAARDVGYESLTQFSREFKRYFGQSPRDFLAS